MKIVHLGLLLLCGVSTSLLSMDYESEDSQEMDTQLVDIPEAQRNVLKEYYGKRRSAIGQFTAELGQQWKGKTIRTWLDAQLREKKEEYNKQRKKIVLKTFVGTSMAALSGYLSLSDQIAKPELKGLAAGAALVSAAYSLSSIYDFCVLVCPTQEMFVQEIDERNKTYTNSDWHNALLADIGCRYALMQAK